MKQVLSLKELMAVGLMTFALFLGAGNIIFPPTLGHDAGPAMWTAIVGFLITGVGLPLLGVAAVASAGGNVRLMGNRVNPIFSVIFSVLTYLSIGPLLAIPRTGAVAFEIGIAPFLSPDAKTSAVVLFLYSIVFFALTFWLCMNPGKLVDRFGKVITPIMIVLLATLLIRGAMYPLSGEYAPPTLDNPFSKGFLEGYNTMDTLAALVFGIVIANTVRERGITERGAQARIIIQSGIIAVTCLGLLYVGLTYLGATSGHVVGPYENGGELITLMARQLLGSVGLFLLSLAVTFACLTTCVGLITSSAEFFSNLTNNRLSYRLVLSVLILFSLIIMNFGLSTILKISVPLLVMLYPVAIVLIILTLTNNLFGGRKAVYTGGVIGAACISIIDGLAAAGFTFPAFTETLQQLPLMGELMAQGLGWIVPALIGIIIGGIISTITPPSRQTVTE
ncbi:branched-chain amino acid transport system II carrier protein [Aneurinibacillus migulanus]|uniref:branched-chain amino acid transport system II carrier protein n=1 Tax=Aneurinibacillus migulanus TaxID=47500 RepID=UPI002E1CBE07|nr:branched-chain amino acid transport system II carrier protein [Aneurinibacillus migulanus]MED4730439.1 branched-chain amino acid transport system II carrier protein [Aneurinibacillus migulanus]